MRSKTLKKIIEHCFHIVNCSVVVLGGRHATDRSENKEKTMRTERLENENIIFQGFLILLWQLI
jgi:hypothetical protein